MGIPASSRVRRQPQVLDGARPISPGFKVIRQLGRHLAPPRRVQSLQPLADASVQPCPTPRRLPPIAHLAVQRMDKGVALRDAAVRELLHVYRTHQVLPTRQRVAHVVKVVRLQVCRCGADADSEHRAGDTRDLQHPLLLRAQAFDLGFDHLAQTLWDLECDIPQ